MRARLLIAGLTMGWVSLACQRSPGPGPVEPTPEPGASSTELREDEYVFPYGERTIYVYADPTLNREVQRLFSLFEDFRLESVELSADTELPIGWTTLGFRVSGERGERLVVTEPNYEGEPESQQREDISVSLATLARQRGVLEQAGVQGAAINFDQHVLAIEGALDLPDVMLLRVESPGGRMTGWRLTPAEGIAEDDEIESLPVYAIVQARPELLDAMLLPPGYLVLYSGPQLTTIVNERDEVVWDWTLDGELPSGEGSGLIPVPRGDRGPDEGPKAQPLLEPIE